MMNNKNIKAKSSRRKFISNVTKIAFITSGVSSLSFLKVEFAQANSLPNFPQYIDIYLEKYQNWSGEIKARSIWTCSVKNSSEIVAIVNWAKKYNYQVRPKGKMHNWSPFTIANGLEPSAKVILIDTKAHMTKISIDSSQAPSKVTAQTGITMEALLSKLEEHGLGLTAAPAPGELTLGGVLAINGHGTAISSANEREITQGHTYGSLSNLILSVTAITWDKESEQYILKTFERSNPHCQAFLVHLGRAFITEVTLQVGQNQHIRCQSIIGISAAHLFGGEKSSSFNFANFIEKTGRAEAIWFPFTDKPWLKVWTVTHEKKPDASKQVNSPYNYPFSDNIPEKLSNLIDIIISGNTKITPEFGKLQYYITSFGLEYNNAFDLWGWSKNLLLYVKPTTLKLTANGYVVITKRTNIQRVINEFYSKYNMLIHKYKSQNHYPINGPLEIRVTGIEKNEDIINTKAVSPLLSSVNTDYKEWNVGIWFNILTIPGTPFANQFYQEMEEWIYSNYIGTYASARVEWSKGWAYEKNSAWSNKHFLNNTIPKSLYEGQGTNNNWEIAQSILNYYDPHHIFSSPLLNSLI